MANQSGESIAIIGSACRFPGSSSSPSKLWELLHQPRDVLKEFDPDRLNLNRFHHHNGDTHGATDVANKSYLLEEDSRLFDAAFFGISPFETASIDPQQRLLLETVYESFESAGVTLDELRGSLTSVHVGVMTSDYSFIQLRDTETLSKYTATGTANSILSNRISYVFDLKGPSETIDTACSSSLVALHHASQALLTGDCETAVVAGVNLIFDPGPYVTESKLHMLSPDVRSRMWDKAANGYARGEGTAAILLKSLSNALRDGDHIEGIIRATGVNSDGQSPGITMPFAPTQASLIRQVYARAGLDPIKDRPQYFECHGTGTPAGDPVEARAVFESLVGDGSVTSTDNPIYVGSIKTVVGHLEGCAGLAGVMKVLLALKNQIIPPNLLFNELNPAIAPFYGPLRITKEALPWPDLPAGVPARASVNSFGFGGTNAHAIIERFDAGYHVSTSDRQLVNEESVTASNEGVLGPLTFSAASGASLLKSVQAYQEHLKKHPELDIRDLAWLLQIRRSTHRHRAHFSGSSRDAILDSMDEFLQVNRKASSNDIGRQPQLQNPNEVPGILGIFTGQGAQWPAMGREMIQKSPMFRKTVEECEAVLRSLPTSDAPKWSLMEELTADASSSRLSEAAISQPLCTALQLALVNVLAAAGISFDAVVGHSSGEIAATYAAGIITLKGAMQIAYYRGFHAKLAGANGERGGMLAAGLSLEKAQQFCLRPGFKGRIQVAASNAPSSVTLSGDLSAILEAKEQLDEDQVFARQLKVDTAYHSHHMQPCAGPYLQSLLACELEVRQPVRGQCIWNSSVRGDARLLKGDLSRLRGPYWVDNMVKTVMFTQAIESAIWHGGPFDLAIEVGPHPALKGPTEQTLKASYGSVPQYAGTLKRGSSDVQAFSAAVGTTWAQLGPAFVDFSGYRSAWYESQPPAPKVLKGLPPYSWDHDKVYWRESRISKRYRTARDSSHELLGRRTLDDNDQELRWRNVLKLSEIPWLRGHEVLEEVLLPGAAYVSIAAEAAKYIATAARKSIQMLEVENVEILRPCVVPDSPEGVETLFTARLLSATPTDGVLRAKFSYYMCPDQANGSMVHTCSGDISVHLGELATESVLPPRNSVRQNLVRIDSERLYSMFRDIGLNYTGLFHSIKESSRCLEYANATGVWPESSLSKEYLVHPAVLDVAFQTLFIARAHPASRLITSALLPSYIDRVRVSPSAQVVRPAGSGEETKAGFESWVVAQGANYLTGDLNIYDATTGDAFLQVEGLATRMVGEQGASRDRPIFSKTVWDKDASLGLVAPARDINKDAEGLRLAEAVERTSLFYIKSIASQVGPQEREGLLSYHQRMFDAFEQHLETVRNDQHPVLRSKWLADPPSLIHDIAKEHPDSIDLQLCHAVGKNLVGVVRGEVQLLEVMQRDDMLDRFYMSNCASAPINKAIADVVQQISFKFPRCNILEIGAGTGGTTWSVLNQIGDAYDSYTYTDISPGFFPNAEEKFSDFAHKMFFKTLDVEKDPMEQGYAEESYDIIIAANVLHATRFLSTTLENTRKLLKPGGYLVLMEVTGMESVRVTFILGGLPGWWLGVDDGRLLGPRVSVMDWHNLLSNTGFSGADLAMNDVPDESAHCNSMIVSQAVDDNFLRLREPLSFTGELPVPTEPLLIIGGKQLSTSKIMAEIQKLLPRTWRRQVQIVGSIDNIDTAKLTPGMEVLSLQEADDPLFATAMTPKRMEILQNLFINAKNMLWVTGGGKSHRPRSSIFLGIARIVPAELPHLQLQVLGIEAGEAPATVARNCTEIFLRLRATHHENGGVGNMLWYQEPELEVLGNGQFIIPRVMLNKPLNSVYNAARYPVTMTVDGTRIPVKAAPGPGKVMTLQAADIRDSTTQVQVKHALHIPASNSEGVYIACGHVQGSSPSSYMMFSTSNASVLGVESEYLVAIHHDDLTLDTLAFMADNMLARAIGVLVATKAHPKSVLLYEPEESLVPLVAAQIEKQGGQAYFASSRPTTPDGWIKIHPHASKRAIERIVPLDVQLYIDCSGYSTSLTASSTASSTLQACIPPSCVALQLGADILRSAFQGSMDNATPLLKESYLQSKKDCLSQIQRGDYEVVRAAELGSVDATTFMHRRYVTDWQEAESLLMTVQPLEFEGILNPHKTYLLVGMAGGLGLSISQWILRNGGKHLVITSRNPQPDILMLEDARRVGATVHFVPMDVTKRDSVEKVVRTIQETMPPIAGVCNAAMILSDKMFIDMSVEDLNNTLAPKVYGSENLDSVFADVPLDFFILLSSVATTIGNIGQCNYHAANLFMASLASERRLRGLSASVIHIGYVADVGYVTRQDRDVRLDQHFQNVRLSPLSETDVHHAFAEAIRGGKPGSPHGSYDIIMGLETFSVPLTQEKRPLWLSNPRFSHFLPPSTLQSQHQERTAISGNNIRQQVQEAQNEDEAITAVMEAFCRKLEAILQLPPSSVDVQRAIIDLGIDSLVAVEIRTWFLKELGAEVPVVKILGGDTVVQTCTWATKKAMAKNMQAQETKSQGVKLQETKPQEVLAEPVVSTTPVTTTSALEHRTLSTAKILGEAIESESIVSNSETDNMSGSMMSSSKENGSISTGSSEKLEMEDLDARSDNSARVVDGEQGASTALKLELLREEPMSSAQSRIWFLSRHLEDPASYNMVFHYHVQGPLSMARLQHALRVTTQHHECFRMCFYPRLGDGHPMQGILPSALYDIKHVANVTDSDVHREVESLKTKKWDLENGHTLGLTVLTRSPLEHEIIFGYHHMVMDVTGWAIFVTDLNATYQMRTLNKDSGSYLEYALQQLEHEKSGVLEEQLSYWQSEFATIPEVLPLLPMARMSARPATEPSGESNQEYRVLQDSQFNAIKRACRSLGISPFHFQLAVLQVLLARYANVEDICLGVVDAGRQDEHFARTVGTFVNVLPVRFRIPSGQATFASVARAASRKALAAFANAAVSFDQILDKVRAPRSSGSTPIFQAAINYRTGSVMDLPLGDCRMKMVGGKDASVPYDISFGITDTGNGCMIEIHVQDSLYSPEACRTLLDSYVRLLEGFCADTNLDVHSPPIHDKTRVSQAIELGKGPEVDFGWPLTLSQRLLDICRTHSAETALVDQSVTLTYAELVARVHGVSDTMLRGGCNAGTRVAVLCEPSVDAIVAMLAILHIGAVYVPLDISLGTGRHAAIVNSCNPSMLLCHSATEQMVLDLGNATGPVLEVRVDAISNYNNHVVPCSAKPEAPAILLFTSGSTGTPKGIFLTQANFTNHLALKTHALDIGQECVLQQSSLGFDMSIVQMFCALANGGRLVIASSAIRRDPVELTKYINHEGVSFTIATPSEYLVWLRYGAESLHGIKTWRQACMGGEPVTRELKSEFRSLGLSGMRLTNCYGPTEITAAATFQTIQLEDETDDERARHAVGKALPNYTVSILDASGEPQPVQHAGEICIGGKGVALGYLDLAEETNRKFIKRSAEGQRLYRTGDLGKVLPDGTLLCLGRIEGDTQIKLRGLRIELQEVESALLQTAGNRFLSSAVVSRRGDVLVAHATLAPGKEAASEEELAQVLGRLKLPQYFIPAAIIILTTMPMNANGKIDRKAVAALPMPDWAPLKEEPQEKMNVHEGELRLLWERVLPDTGTATRIGPLSDFFLCGGNSLLLMKLQAAIRESMGIAVSTRVLYQASTLRAMSAHITERQEHAVYEEPASEIDWSEETAIPTWLRAQIDESSKRSPKTARKTDGRLEVLMTGATGFLGGWLLKSILTLPSVRKVHCVGILADEKRLLHEDEKVQCYTGSLLSPTLGLGAGERKRLEETVDVIIHAGSSGHCLNTYSSLRIPNLQSTQVLASIALPRSIPMLFLSTSRVVLLSGNTAPPPSSLLGFPPPTDGLEGYTVSKWASEAFLERLVGRVAPSPWMVSVHRPAVVVSEHAPLSDALNALLRYSASMRCVPHLDNVRGYLDFAPLEKVVQELTEAVLHLAEAGRDNKAGEATIQFRHHSGGVKVPINEIRTHMESTYGGTFEEVNMADWIRRASQEGIDPLITAYLEGILENGAPMEFPYLGEV